MHKCKKKRNYINYTSNRIELEDKGMDHYYVIRTCKKCIENSRENENGLY